MDAFCDDLRSIDIGNLSISYLIPISESVVNFLIECNDNLHCMNMEQLEQYKELCNYILTFISTVFGKDSKINKGYRMEKDENLRKKLKEALNEALNELKYIYRKSIYKNVNKILLHINQKIELENYKTILFTNKKYFDIHYVAELEEGKLYNTSELEYIGGYPLLTKTERWPTDIHGVKLTFIAQFVYNINIHNENILYRIFADLRDDADIEYLSAIAGIKKIKYYTYMPIPITHEEKQFVTNIKLSYSDDITYPIIPKYQINNWIEHKVLKPYCEIQNDIPITEEEYHQINVENANVGFTVIRFPDKMPPTRDLDKLPLCNIPSDLLDQKNNKRYHFYHQGRMEIV